MTQEKIYEIRIAFSTAEIPHKPNPEKQLQGFISKVGTPVSKHCLIQYFKENLELHTAELSKKVVLRPAFLEAKSISRLCSKFNTVASVAHTNHKCTYCLSIEELEIDGQTIPDTKVMKMTVHVNDLAVDMVLKNLFSLFDES